jgi:hypothetical protein
MRSPILQYLLSRSLLPFLLGFLLIQTSSCKKNITIRERVYFEDAEDGVANNILAVTGTGANYGNMVRPFAGTNVVGNFNNTVVTIQLDQMPAHNMVYVAFDLYTHDRWEGNRVGLPDIVDVWNIRVNELFQLSTTFSNIRSQPQSYPEWIGSTPNISRGNAIDTLLPGNCLWEDRKNGSSKYRIAFSRPHTANQLLVQMNDALRGSYCEKSWSIDNILIEAITN